MWLGETEVPTFVSHVSQGEAHAFDAGSIDLLPHVEVPFGTISSLRLRPWLSNLWIGKLMGLDALVSGFLVGGTPAHLLPSAAAAAVITTILSLSSLRRQAG